MRAMDVMTTAVVAARPDMTVRDAAALLADNHISGMPVVDDEGKVVGMITEGDLFRRVEIGTEVKPRPALLELFRPTQELAGEYVRSHARFVSEMMTAEVVSATEDTSLADIAELMERHRIKRIPVLKDGKLAGLVSRANLIRVLASVDPNAQPGASTDDAAIREAILAATQKTRWALRRDNVIVTHGVVHLWGLIDSEDEGRAIRIAVENVPGVKEVNNHLAHVTFPMF